jgi:hypothetical protein
MVSNQLEEEEEEDLLTNVDVLDSTNYLIQTSILSGMWFGVDPRNTTRNIYVIKK